MRQPERLSASNEKLPTDRDFSGLHAFMNNATNRSIKSSQRDLRRFDPYLYNRHMVHFDLGIAEVADWRDNIDKITEPIIFKDIFGNVR